jgi:ribosomal protein S15P/S13E
MAKKRTRSRNLRLAKRAKIPKGEIPCLDQLNRLLTDIVPVAQHLLKNPAHRKDTPAFRRFKSLRQSIGDLLINLANQDSACLENFYQSTNFLAYQEIINVLEQNH